MVLASKGGSRGRRGETPKLKRAVVAVVCLSPPLPGVVAPVERVVVALHLGRPLAGRSWPGRYDLSGVLRPPPAQSHLN